MSLNTDLQVLPVTPARACKMVFNLVHESPYNLEDLFDYETTADKLIETFELLATDAIVPIKALVHYNIDNSLDIQE